MIQKTSRTTDPGAPNKTNLLKAAYSRVVDFIYPPLCHLCDNPRAELNSWFCSPCLSKLAKNHSARKACPHCAQNLSLRSCACEIVSDHPFEKAFSLFDFDDTIRGICHEIKYHGRSRMATAMGKAYAHVIPEDFLQGAEGIVVVPLHYWRRIRRGYNQAEALAKGIQEGLHQHIPLYAKALHRRKHTRTQTKLNRKERQKNLSGAFTVPEKHLPLVENKKLILVDDVMTTGATTGVCTHTLLEAGAKSVRILSLARD